jgi:UDP-N-acetylmuramoyl-tripeptide--D-alanyl-D-alanine ligase
MPSLSDLQLAVDGRWLGGAPRVETRVGEVGRVVIDSRHVTPGDVFWGLRGALHNGSDFAADAFARGAAGAVVDMPVEPPAGRWALQVDDTQAGLWKWAELYRRQFTGTVIGVTGSAGKTTTRHMIHTVLGQRLAGTASPRNYNNHVGVPLSMLALKPEHDYAVLELGASHKGEIAALATLCRPKIGVITQVGDAHLAGFGGRQGIAEAKGELLAALPADGRAVLADDYWLRSIADRCAAPIEWLGTTPSCSLRAEHVQLRPGRLQFTVSGCPFSVPVWGRHHLIAALVSVSVGRMFGLDLPEIAERLAAFEPLPMRCEVREVRGATIINDAYNANPSAMRAALELIRDLDPPGRRIIVSGDMAELGEQSGALHWQFGHQVVTLARADLLIACGQFARHVVAAARAAGMPRTRSIPCRTVDEALPYLGQAIMPGDTVLVKGSRVMGMERVVEALTQYPRRRSA